jgi:2-polyprenyl-3-methyl-5-hydroxy-6-metoxy-1,4-benzoquinol methylase
MYLDIEHVGPSDQKVRELYTPLIGYFDGCQLVLDLGCGRGIFLEMLRNRGIHGVGCDSETKMVLDCRGKGLSVEHIDGISFLQRTTQHFDGICCGHVIEHLTPSAALSLIDSCFQKLNWGGILMVVTPNPEDLRVITKTFWLDLTHVRPYPRLLLEEMLRNSGFVIHASHDTIKNSSKELRGWRVVVASVLREFVRRLVGADLVYRGDTVVVARKEKLPESGT